MYAARPPSIEVATTGNAVFAHLLQTQRIQCRGARIETIQIVHLEQYVDHGLRTQPGHRGAAHVVKRPQFISEQRAQHRLLSVEALEPAGVPVHDLNTVRLRVTHGTPETASLASAAGAGNA